jgi:AcrR family transcriptional regulator
MARPLDEQGHALLDAASRLLSAEGPAALTVRRIATEAGCSTMGVYSRFGGKDGVIEELYKEGVELLFASMDLVETDDPLEDLRHCGLSYRTNALAHGTHYMIVFGGAIPGFEPSPEAVAMSLAAFGRMAARVRRAQDAGLLAAEPTDKVAEIIWATIHGHVMLELIGMSATLADPFERYQRTLQMLFDGLAPKAVSTAEGNDMAGGAIGPA